MAGASKANQRQSSRQKARYQAYRNEERREKNKARRIMKHLTRYPEDEVAMAALDKLPERAKRNL